MDGVKNAYILVVLLLLCKSLSCTEPETKEPTTDKDEALIESESKDGKLEIIKRIKKVNDDGSYTIGYEADDGSFKIESRDVLGNVKGTYGFVDDEGTVKRVSYSTSNSSEIISKPSEATVVQRIPSKTSNSKEKISFATTRRPSTTSYVSTTPTPSTSSTSSFVQSIPKRRVTSSRSTTQKPNYNEVINLNSDKSTGRSSAIIYTSAAPRVLLQRPSISTTAASSTHSHTVKSEGVLLRPEISTTAPDEIPLFNRLSLSRHEITKPVNEEPEATSNILRRELSPDKLEAYNFQDHVFSLQQSIGNDESDVYNTGVSGTQRPPLFTTTLRPRLVPIISSTTATPIIAVPRPTVKYASSYAREDNVVTPEYTQETSSTESPTALPVAQIPANREQPEPLVAVHHPLHRGTILVPLSQLRGNVIPVESTRDVQESRRHYIEQNGVQHFRETTPETPVVEIERQKVRMLNPGGMRSLPVQVDENGYVREMSRQIPTPYPIAVPVPNISSYRQATHEEIDNSIESIEPPVSVKEFQKLLQHLITRQKKLEKINALMSSKPEINQIQPIRYRTVYRPTPTPYIIQRIPVRNTNGPIQFVAQQDVVETQQRTPTRQFIAVPSPQHHDAIIRQHMQRQRYYSNDFEQQQSTVANRRVARLLPSSQQLQETDEQQQEEYLPPDVREMLLLKMLQLAINPALPIEEDEEVQQESTASTVSQQYNRAPVRNVEILGEEPETPKRNSRTKRYKQVDMEYLE